MHEGRHFLHVLQAAGDGGRPEAERAFILRLLSQPLSQVRAVRPHNAVPAKAGSATLSRKCGRRAQPFRASCIQGCSLAPFAPKRPACLKASHLSILKAI